MKNFLVTPHFSFFEATRTDQRGFVALNREMGRRRLAKIVLVCEAHEQMRALCGGAYVMSSGYRCPELNEAIGGSPTSQHMTAEAGDGWPLGLHYDRAGMWRFFASVIADLKARRIMFGQLILEELTLPKGGSQFWIHRSLGFPFRPLDKCGQIMLFKDGKYRVLEYLSFPEYEKSIR